MKSVLISIQPKWCESIARATNPVMYSAIKTIEVRKTKPKLKTPFKVYIYCTKDKKKTLWDSRKYDYPYRYIDEKSHNIFDKSLNGKVIGEFVCDEITEIYLYKDDIFVYGITPPVDVEYAKHWGWETCLTTKELFDYLCLDKGYAWHISDLVIYDKPKELSEFYVVNYGAVNQCEYRERIYNNPDFTNGAMLPGSYLCKDKNDWCTKCKTKPITIPPQSWCYVKELLADGF